MPTGGSRCFHTAILIQNAGSVNDTTKDIMDLVDLQESQEYFNLNLASVIPTTARFIEWTKKGNVTGHTIIINISSLYAIQPEAGFNLYCSAKAARDMLFKVNYQLFTFLYTKMSWRPPIILIRAISSSGSQL